MNAIALRYRLNDALASLSLGTVQQIALVALEVCGLGIEVTTVLTEPETIPCALTRSRGNRTLWRGHSAGQSAASSIVCVG